MTELVTVDNLAEYLTDRFPEAAVDIAAMYVDDDPAWLVTAELVRDVFVSRIFRRAVVDRDVKVLDLCYSAVEDMLSAGDAQVCRSVREYVVPAVLSSAQWAGDTRLRGGPLLAGAIDSERGGRGWRTSDVDYHDRRPLRSASIGVHGYHGVLYAHAYRPHADGGSGIVRPFLAMPSDVEPEVAGSRLAVLIRDVFSSEIQESAHDVAELLKFVGDVEWRDFHTNARTVTIIVAEDSFRACVSPRHKRQDGDWFGSRPGELLDVADWREAAALGRAVLTALAISSTTGWNAPAS